MARREYTAGRATTLAVAFNIGNTSFTIADDGSEATWPTSADFDFFVTVDAGTAYEERVLCSARAGRTVTVAASGRGKDATGEKNHAVGATVWPSLSAQDIDEANAHIESAGFASHSKSVHGLGSGDGVVVGTDKTQTLTAKTLTSPTINTPLISSPTISGTISGSVITGANIVDGTIANAEISGSAAISVSKIDATASTLAFGTNASAITANGLTISAAEISNLDGVATNLTVGHRLIGVKTYTTAGSASYTIATEFPNARALLVMCQGGGGGGGGCTTTGAGQSASGGSGGGGGYAEKFILVSTLSASETITVGAGGAGGGAGANNGVAGGKSSFFVGGVETVIGNGGALGVGDTASTAPVYGATAGAGGTATGGDLNISGARGGRGFSFFTNGNTMYPVTGGGSQLSPHGVLEALSSGVPGNTGGSFGQGGGGGANVVNQTTARSGGAGGAGIVIIYYYA